MDSRLRELERWAREEGSLEAEAELLRYRLREGELSVEWLAVAAHLGHRAARQVLGRLVPVATYVTLWTSLRDEPWPREACMRVAAEWVEPEATGRLERAAHGVLAFCADPTPELQANLREQREEARDPVSTVLDTALSETERGAQSALRTLLPAPRPGHAAGPGEGRRVREALIPWVLKGEGEPPPGLLPPDPAAWEGFGVAPAPARPAQSAFRRRLQSPEVVAESKVLSRRLRERSLSRERVRLAAFLGEPAAWRVAEPQGEPDLDPPHNSTRIAGGLIAALARLAPKGLPRQAQRRQDLLAHLQADPTSAPRSLVFPPWWRPFVGRLAVAAARAALARVPDPDPRSQAALAEAEAFLREPTRDPEPVRSAIAAAARAVQASRWTPPEQAAARACAWAARLVLATATTARRPTFTHRGQDVFEQCLLAGLAPADLWSLLRAEGVAFALEPEESPGDLALRVYRPEARYLAGERIRHATFGEGLVEVSRGDRIDVWFGEEARTLVQAEV